DAAADRFQNVARGPDPHEVVGKVFGKERREIVEYFDHRRMGLSDRKSADGQTVDRERGGELEALFSQSEIRSALHDPEDALTVLAGNLEKALRPLRAPVHRCAERLIGVRTRD